MTHKVNLRKLASRAVYDIAIKQQPFYDVPESESLHPKDRAWVRYCVLGVCRDFIALEAILNQILDKPLRSRDKDIFCLLLVGLYQCRSMRIPDHAAVKETVAAIPAKKRWARGLVNATLRSYCRERETLEALINQSLVTRLRTPAWLYERLRDAWPQWLRIIIANNRIPRLTLHINPAISREDYAKRCRELDIEVDFCRYSATGLRIKGAIDVTELPGYNEGEFIVQDEGAQFAASVLDPSEGARVLDACAAPGGKTIALMMKAPKLREVIAIDNDIARLERLQENCERCKVTPSIVHADAANTLSWWDGRAFDSILLDAPCSATGVIRRHPDIKLLRSEKDVARAVTAQAQLLTALWPCLKRGGRLLYVTCSMLPEENTEQIKAFLARTADAKLIPIDATFGIDVEYGRQILPGHGFMDGFFYALIERIG